MEKLKIQCLDFKYVNLYDEKFFRENQDLEGQLMTSYNFGSQKLLTFRVYEDPISDKTLFKLSTINNHMNVEYDLAKELALEAVSNDTLIMLAILPMCFNIKNTHEDFFPGQEVVIAGAINVPALNYNENKIGIRYTTLLDVEFGKVKSVLPSGIIKVELEAIPGQIEICRNPALLGPKFEVIPLLM